MTINILIKKVTKTNLFLLNHVMWAKKNWIKSWILISKQSNIKRQDNQDHIQNQWNINIKQIKKIIEPYIKLNKCWKIKLKNII